MRFYTDEEIIAEVRETLVSYDEERAIDDERRADERREKELHWLRHGNFGTAKELYAVIEDEQTIRYGVIVGTIGVYDDERVAKAVADELNRVKPRDNEFFSYSYSVCPLSLNHSPLDDDSHRIGCTYIE